MLYSSVNGIVDKKLPIVLNCSFQFMIFNLLWNSLWSM